MIGAGAALCGGMASAQESDGNIIGPPQLRDFSLEPQNRVVTQPESGPSITPLPEAPQPPLVRVAPPPAAEPRATTPPREAVPRETARTQPAPASAAASAQPSAAAPTSVPEASPPVAEIQIEAPSSAPPAREFAENVPESAEEAPAPQESNAGFNWLYALPALVLVLIGAALLRRRRGGGETASKPVRPVAAPAVASPSRPRPEPGMRPWLELELKTERATFNDTEASVNFELEIRNSGKSEAKNLRIDVKMFNGSEQQDKEIGAFFRTAGRESTRLNLPVIGAGESGVIKGEVGLPRDQMRALRLDDRMLFIPVIAVNALYDCDDGRTGQTSRSYIVGRELQAESERMGAFRVDQGPRIWRTVGQRPHTLARRV